MGWGEAVGGEKGRIWGPRELLPRHFSLLTRPAAPSLPSSRPPTILSLRRRLSRGHQRPPRGQLHHQRHCPSGAGASFPLPLLAPLLPLTSSCLPQASIPIKSLKPALIFLTGLFLYDIYFVFFSPGGVMESVATSLEGPVKLLSPRAAVRREGRRPNKEGITSPYPPRFQSRFSRSTAFFSPCPYSQSTHPFLSCSPPILPSPLGPSGGHGPRPVPLLHPGTRRHRSTGPLRRSSQAHRRRWDDGRAVGRIDRKQRLLARSPRFNKFCLTN